MKRITFSEEAKADLRAIPQHIAMNMLIAIHRLADTGGGRVKELKGKDGEKRLRVGDHRVRFTGEHPTPSAFTPSRTARTHIAEKRKESFAVCR